MCLFGEFTVFRVTGAYRAVNWFMLRSLARDVEVDSPADETSDEAGRIEVSGEALDAREIREDTGARVGDEVDEEGGGEEHEGGISISSSSRSSRSSRGSRSSIPFSPCLWWTFSTWPFRCSFWVNLGMKRSYLAINSRSHEVSFLTYPSIIDERTTNLEILKYKILYKKIH